MGIVYKITNTVNTKSYIGITKKTFRQRYNYRDDWWNAPSVNRCLKRAVEKYGSEHFTVEILENCPDELLEEKEIFYIEKYNTFKGQGYNLTSGGNYKYELSVETKDKLSKSQKKRFETQDIWNKGKTHSKEHRKRHSETLKRLHKEGKWEPWNKGIKTGKMKPEHIKNSANAHKKKVTCFDKDGNFIKEYEGLIDTKVDGFNPSSVSRCCKGSLKTHRGYKWKYSSDEVNNDY